MVPILIVDEFPDALNQYSRSGGLSIDRMLVAYPAAPHFLIILPIDVDTASEEICHTDKLSNKYSDKIWVHMKVPQLSCIESTLYPELGQRPIVLLIVNLILRHKVSLLVLHKLRELRRTHLSHNSQAQSTHIMLGNFLIRNETNKC